MKTKFKYYFFPLVVLTIFFSSCRKDHTCVCTSKWISAYDGSEQEKVETYTITDTRSDAEERCKAKEYSTSECELK